MWEEQEELVSFLDLKLPAHSFVNTKFFLLLPTGRTGTSITFMERRDWRNAKELIKILTEADQEVPEFVIGMAKRLVSCSHLTFEFDMPTSW